MRQVYLRRGPAGLRAVGARALALVVFVTVSTGCPGGSSGGAPSPTRFTISGTVTGASNVAVELSGALTRSTTTDASGQYLFQDLVAGTYTISPSKLRYALSPARAQVVVDAANVTGVDFTASPVPTYTISGTVTAAASADVELATTGAIIATARTGLDASYVFTGIPSGSYTVSVSKPGLAFSPTRRAVVVAGADRAVADFSAAVALASYDPLTADTLDGARWLTPEFVRTISGGKALLSVRADGMESNLTEGITYTNALTAQSGGSRVTTFRADVTIPAAGVVRTGAAAIYGGLRLYYQPAADRNLAFPAASMNQLVATLELYDGGSGLRVRRRFFHCDDAACISMGSARITYDDPPAFTVSGVNATAPAAYDTTYTFTISLDEAGGVFYWLVQGGSFGAAGLTGSADVSAWAAGKMTLASTTDGFLSAKLHARTSDASAAGGGSGAFTASFDNVVVGTNGARAAPFDDFSSLGSSEATGFSPARWGASANGGVQASSDGVHVVAGVPTYNTLAETALSALNPAFDAWQVDLSLAAVRGYGSHRLTVGSAFAHDGTASPAHDRTGDLFCEYALLQQGFGFAVARCDDPACAVATNVAAVPSDRLMPKTIPDVGTVHSVFQQWDPASKTLVVRIDDGAPVFFGLEGIAVSAPRVPARYVRASASVPSGLGLGAGTEELATPSAADGRVSNVRVAP